MVTQVHVAESRPVEAMVLQRPDVTVIPDVIDEAGPSTDTSTRPRRLTRAPTRFNDGASESESDSDLSDAEVDDELHSNGDASEDEEEDAALAAAFAEAAGALRPIQSK